MKTIIVENKIPLKTKIIQGKIPEYYGGVLITTYETYSNLDISDDDLKSVGIVVVDEAHYIKNPNATRSKNIRALCSKVERVLFLTGTAIENKVDEMLSLLGVLNQNVAGIEVVNIQLVEMTPPEAVLASFQDLASARQDKAIYINEATAYQNTVVPQARADAYAQIAEANAYKEEKINTATGDAQLFSERQSAYRKTKDVTEFRLYMEAMDKILPNVQKILLGADIKIENAELWMKQNNPE